MKKIFKIFCTFALINLFLVGNSFASDDEKVLKDELYQAVKDTVDGKLFYQVNIKTVYGPSDIDIYMANTDEDKLPSASTIKPLIGLTILDRVEKGEMAYTEDIRKDLDLSLRLSDNEATNRLIEALGDFDKVNSYIRTLTKKDRTKLNRLMLAKGKENTANVKDLSLAMLEIYKSDSRVARDMAKSLSKSSMKRSKLLKNINPKLETMNKTGELKTIENDLAFVKTKSQGFIISLMTENNGYMDTYNQILLINKLGEDVVRSYEAYEKSYEARERNENKKLMERLNTPEKKLAYAVFTNQVFVNAGEILLESSSGAIDEIRADLLEKIGESEEILEESKKTLANFSKESISSEDDFLVNLVRLLYTDKDLNSEINRDLALAFYKNKASVKAGEILLTDSPRRSLNIRRGLLKNIKTSEEILGQTQKYFEGLNAEN